MSQTSKKSLIFFNKIFNKMEQKPQNISYIPD